MNPLDHFAEVRTRFRASRHYQPGMRLAEAMRCGKATVYRVEFHRQQQAFMVSDREFAGFRDDMSDNVLVHRINEAQRAVVEAYAAETALAA